MVRKKMKTLKNLEKNALWVLLIINHFSKHNGIDLEGIAKADKRKVNLNIVEIAKILTELKSQGLVDSDIGIQEVYSINSKGKKVLNKNLRQLKSSEFMDFLSLAPDEIILRYRIYHIERFIFFGIIGWMLFQLSLYLIRTNHIYSALIIFLVSILFIGLGIGFLSNILTIVLYEYVKSIDGWLRNWKIPRIKRFVTKAFGYSKKLFGKFSPYVLFLCLGLLPSYLFIKYFLTYSETKLILLTLFFGFVAKWGHKLLGEKSTEVISNE